MQCSIRQSCSSPIGGDDAATKDFYSAKAFLSEDQEIAKLISGHGMPNKMTPKQAFDSCVRAVVFQQLHPKAARSIVARLKAALRLETHSPFIPCVFIGRTASELRTVGLSQRKAEYILGCAQRWHQPSSPLTDANLRAMSDDEVLTAITDIRGFGEWSAHFVMINSLCRANVLATGDFALNKGAERFFGKKLSKTQLVESFERFQPYRTYAAFFMYLLHDAQSSPFMPNDALASGK